MSRVGPAVAHLDLELVDDYETRVSCPPAADVRAVVTAEGLARPSVRATLSRIIPLWGAFALTAGFGLWADRTGVWLACWFVMAWIFAGNAAIAHECAHGHLFRSGRANRALGTLAAAPLLVSFSSYRAYHFEHHRRATRSGDPEGTPMRFSTRSSYLGVMLVAGLAVFFESMWFSVRTVVRHAPQWVRTPAQRRAMNQNAALLVGVLALAVLGLAEAPRFTLDVWIVPALLTILVLAPLLFLPEHYGATGIGSILDNTTSIRSNAMLRFLFWNTNFHAAHHLAPGVPFHKIERVHALIEPELARQWSRSSYTSFHWSLLRLPFRRTEPRHEA